MNTRQADAVVDRLRQQAKQEAVELIQMLRANDLLPEQRRKILARLEQALKDAKIRAGEPPDHIAHGGVR